MDIFSILNGVGETWPAAGRKLLTALVPQIIPLAGGMGMKVEKLDDQSAVMRLPLKRRTRNHVGSIYFGAMATAAEITMGLYVFRRYVPGPYGVLVTRAEFDFMAKAKTDVRATCAPGPELFERVDAALALEGKASDWVDVELTDMTGKAVVRARFQIAVRDFAA